MSTLISHTDPDRKNIPHIDAVLTVSCPAKRGLVARISGFLVDHECYISEMHQYDDEDNQLFFTRIQFRSDSANTPSLDILRAAFSGLAHVDQMQWEMRNRNDKMNVIIMVSEFDHCLNDLLYRYRIKELNMNIVGVVSNHETLRHLVESRNIPFHHLPINKNNKREQEAALQALKDETNTELIVLARYMQILTDEFCLQNHGKIINIHHSFLPGFKGAKPYHQAYARGVKLIGASAHYVTGDLDEGPIIEQAVSRVNHTFVPEKMISAGRDLECQALARAVKAHIEHRVFLNGNCTVVFY